MQSKIIDGNEIRKWENENGYSIRITNSKDVSSQYIKVASLKVQDDEYNGRKIRQLTIIDNMGDEWELSQYNGDCWNEDDLTRVKKGSIVAFRDDEHNCILVTGFDPKYLERLNKKYFLN